jgi:hypothetical protein
MCSHRGLRNRSLGKAPRMKKFCTHRFQQSSPFVSVLEGSSSAVGAEVAPGRGTCCQRLLDNEEDRQCV